MFDWLSLQFNQTGLEDAWSPVSLKNTLPWSVDDSTSRRGGQEEANRIGQSWRRIILVHVVYWKGSVCRKSIAIVNCDLTAGTIEICNETYDPVVQGQDPRWNSFDKDWTILNPFNILRQVISPAVCSQFCCGELVVCWYSINSILKRLRVLSRSHLPHLSSSSYKISCFPSLSLNDLAFQLPLDSHCIHLRKRKVNEHHKINEPLNSFTCTTFCHPDPSCLAVPVPQAARIFCTKPDFADPKPLKRARLAQPQDVTKQPGQPGCPRGSFPKISQTTIYCRVFGVVFYSAAVLNTWVEPRSTCKSNETTRLNPPLDLPPPKPPIHSSRHSEGNSTRFKQKTKSLEEKKKHVANSTTNLYRFIKTARVKWTLA